MAKVDRHVKLLSLHLENFGPYRGAHDFALDNQGLVSIVGVNECDLGADANGAGKSAIVDALLWGLYGETGPRKESTQSDGGLKTDDVVNEAEGRDCLVQVAFESGDVLYRTTRFRHAGKPMRARLGFPDYSKANGAFLFADASSSSAAPAPPRVVEDLDSANVQSAIDKALGLDHKLATQVLVRSQEDAYNFCQATPKERFDILTQIEDLTALDDVEERARNRGRALIADIANLSGKVTGLRTTIDMLAGEDVDARVTSWEAARAERIADISNRRYALTAERDQLAGQLVARPQLAAQLQQADEALQTLASTPPEPVQVAAWSKEAGRLRMEVGGLQGTLSAAQATAAKIARSKPGTCEECGQNVAPEHVAQRRDEIERVVSTSKIALDAARAQLAAADKNHADAKTIHDAQCRQIQDQRAQWNGARANLMSQSGRLDTVDRTIYGIDNERLPQLQRDLERAQAEENPHRVRAIENAKRLEELRAGLAQLEAEAARVQTEAGLVDWWVRHIPSMKAWIFDNVMGEITRDANRWLTHLMQGSAWVQVDSTTVTKEGEARDKIGLRIFRWLPSGGFVERPFRRWSGGEKRRIALAVDWALAGRLANRSHARCSFLALDEVDRHLDKSGREGLLVALNELRKEKQTILCISHSFEMKTADQTWVVRKTKDGSSVQVVTGAPAAPQVVGDGEEAEGEGSSELVGEDRRGARSKRRARSDVDQGPPAVPSEGKRRTRNAR